MNLGFEPADTLEVMTDKLKDDAINMMRKIDTLNCEAKVLEDSVPTVTITIGTTTFKNIDSKYFDIPIGEFVSTHLERVEENRVTNYLKSKYDGFNGVPHCNLQDELQVTSERMISIDNYLREELEIKMLKDLFIPFELVTTLVLMQDK